jgi:ADP-L-glycero-D-manno-heptose 6-epimerase
MQRVIVTGGAGFIGSALVWKLNREGIDDILIVDNLGTSAKWKNLVGLRYADYLHKDAFLRQIQAGILGFVPDAIVHLGACSATTETDADYLMANNTHYTRLLAEWAVARGVRFLYASSAATYGDGEHGFSDDDAITPRLRPLNRYGYSKHLFDLQARRSGLAEKIVGVKFFNVFGPNEYHKGPMTSVVYNAFHQVSAGDPIRLFRSYRDEYADGGQVRDFVYVKDCVDVLYWWLTNPQVNGLFNLGTGTARSWNDLARAVFAALGQSPRIAYIDMPVALQGGYQYFTEARMEKLRAAGYTAAFTSLEDAVADYVRHYLDRGLVPLSVLDDV